MATHPYPSPSPLTLTHPIYYTPCTMVPPPPLPPHTHKTLEEDWGRQQQSEQLLRNQLKRSQDDLLRAGRHLETRRREKDTMKEKIDEINLHIDNTQRESKKVVKQKQVRHLFQRPAISVMMCDGPPIRTGW